ncbi:hypothetical protein GCM10018781_72360 [Kitasatospora indigofera]|uniref:Uncharacterized protein n=1 Tax=Kitasatospora indigofera TaxID=67307 RepID=A0A919L615_9ACTN|nr:hypothetical protein [Kitasatospora indigofera]GHH83981.1 hypothetical protein GCM10018781_72360 [Kitasatospora indigofera]
MKTDQDGRTLAQALKDRAGAFVNSHVDLWVGVEPDATLVLAGNDAQALFQAAADWLADDPQDVLDVGWERQAAEPTQALRIRLVPRGTAGATVPAPAVG